MLDLGITKNMTKKFDNNLKYITGSELYKYQPKNTFKKARAELLEKILTVFIIIFWLVIIFRIILENGGEQK